MDTLETYHDAFSMTTTAANGAFFTMTMTTGAAFYLNYVMVTRSTSA
jgi:hypothetical protein